MKTSLIGLLLVLAASPALAEDIDHEKALVAVGFSTLVGSDPVTWDTQSGSGRSITEVSTINEQGEQCTYVSVDLYPSNPGYMNTACRRDSSQDYIVNDAYKMDVQELPAPRPECRQVRVSLIGVASGLLTRLGTFCRTEIGWNLQEIQ
jgi:hypothetical protein